MRDRSCTHLVFWRGRARCSLCGVLWCQPIVKRRPVLQQQFFRLEAYKVGTVRADKASNSPHADGCCDCAFAISSGTGHRGSATDSPNGPLCWRAHCRGRGLRSLAKPAAAWQARAGGGAMEAVARGNEWEMKRKRREARQEEIRLRETQQTRTAETASTDTEISRLRTE